MKKENYDYFIAGRSKIKARIIETSDDTISEFKDRVCVFNRQEISEALFIVVGSDNIFLGKINQITKKIEANKEVWNIETNMGAYRFEILNKSEINRTQDKESIEHLRKLLNKACNDIIDNFVADIFINGTNTSDKNIENNTLDDIEIPTFLRRRR